MRTTRTEPQNLPEMTLALAPARRNPGPSWGYRFLRAADILLPECIYKPLRAAGTFIAMLLMPAQRRHSRAYLALVLPRAPAWRDTFRHFFAFEEMLMAKLRLINGAPPRAIYAPSCPGDIKHWLDNGGAALIGSFHIGVSDLQGFQLGATEKHTIHVVRERVGNSHDTDKLGEKFGARLRFIWVNDPGAMIFTLKDAADDPAASIALKCDRIEQRARTAAFEFLGARRLFPVTIYLLAAIFKRPVMLCFGIPAGPRAATVYSSPRLDIAPGESRESVLARGHEHFQNFLRVVETQLRAHPYQWFNFLPMNPPEPAANIST